LLKVSVAAKKIGVDRATVKSWIKRGDLPGYKVGGNYMVEEKDLDAFLEKSKINTEKMEEMKNV